jgi:hypothetical protein
MCRPQASKGWLVACSENPKPSFVQQWILRSTELSSLSYSSVLIFSASSSRLYPREEYRSQRRDPRLTPACIDRQRVIRLYWMSSYCSLRIRLAAAIKSQESSKSRKSREIETKLIIFKNHLSMKFARRFFFSWQGKHLYILHDQDSANRPHLGLYDMRCGRQYIGVVIPCQGPGPLRMGWGWGPWHVYRCAPHPFPFPSVRIVSCSIAVASSRWASSLIQYFGSVVCSVLENFGLSTEII